MALLRTTFLFALLTALFLGMGWLFAGTSGMLFGLLIAVVANVISYWYSDRIVLHMYGAKPCTDKTVTSVVTRIARKAQLPVPRTYIIDADVPNAFATGRDAKHATVTVTKGLLNKLNEKELEGVLAHEIGHVKNRDTLLATAAATISGALTWLAYLFMFGNDERNRNIVSFLVLFIVTPLAASLIRLAISRSREFGADTTGAAWADPEALATALEKITASTKHVQLQGNPSTAHLFIVNPFATENLAGLFSTHPSVEERTRRLRSMKSNV